MLPGEPSRSTSRNVLIAGVGLGALSFIGTRLGELFPPQGMPRAASTLLDSGFPLFAEAFGIPGRALMMVAIIGIPLLTVAALSHRRLMRALMLSGACVLAFAAIAAQAPPEGASAAGGGLFAMGLLLVALAVGIWGTLSGWSWVVAALTFLTFGALRQTVYAPTHVEQGAAVLAVLVAVGLSALGVRHAQGRAFRARWN